MAPHVVTTPLSICPGARLLVKSRGQVPRSTNRRLTPQLTVEPLTVEPFTPTVLAISSALDLASAASTICSLERAF